MLRFDVRGDPLQLVDSIQRPWTPCKNLGATESILTACAVTTHAHMLREDRPKVGIADGFVRISVGIEDPDDWIRGSDDALGQIRRYGLEHLVQRITPPSGHNHCVKQPNDDYTKPSS